MQRKNTIIIKGKLHHGVKRKAPLYCRLLDYDANIINWTWRNDSIRKEKRAYFADLNSSIPQRNEIEKITKVS